jgi:hypothetical protein
VTAPFRSCAMNPANLQIEGLLMAVAEMHRLMVERGLVSATDVATALRRAEARITSDDRFEEGMPLANRDAMCFPIRLLMLANSPDFKSAGFSELARAVGLSKQPYNDQR